MVGGAERVGKRTYQWRKLNRLLTLLIGDTMQEQLVFPAYGATDGESDNLICAQKLVTNLMTGNKLEVVVQSFAEGGKNKNSEALQRFIAMDNSIGHYGCFGAVHVRALDCSAEVRQRN